MNILITILSYLACYLMGALTCLGVLYRVFVYEKEESDYDLSTPWFDCEGCGYKVRMVYHTKDGMLCGRCIKIKTQQA